MLKRRIVRKYDLKKIAIQLLENGLKKLMQALLLKHILRINIFPVDNADKRRIDDGQYFKPNRSTQKILTP